MKKSEICAVIVSHKSPQEVISCFNSLVDQVGKVIVIDNSDDQVLRDMVYSLNCHNNPIFVFNGANRGLSAALNQGLRYSLENNYVWTLLLDQDSTLSENMIAEMVRSYSRLDDESKKKTAAVVSAVIDRDFCEPLPAIITGKLFNIKVISPLDDSFVHFHITSGSLIKNEIIGTVGLMNEYYFIDYVDFDYCFRILDNKFKILLSKNALLYHSLAEKKKKLFFHLREHNAARIYYQTRNRLFVLLKYGRTYRSFFYAESVRFVGKLFRIIFLESDKLNKLMMYCRGIKDFITNCKQTDTLK